MKEDNIRPVFSMHTVPQLHESPCMAKKNIMAIRKQVPLNDALREGFTFGACL